MPTLIEHISRDIWHYLSKTFLLPEEVSALSSTCRRFRSDFMRILFREVVITAVHDPEYATYIDFLANLIRIEKRIRYFAQSPNICAAIRVVELRQCRPVWWVQLRHRFRTRTVAHSKLLQNFIHSEYLRIYSEVVRLVNMLPNLRLVYLRETDFTRLPFYNPSRNYTQRFHEHSASENLLELAVDDAHSSAERLPVSVIFTSFQDGETGDLDLNSPFRNEVSQIRQYFKDVLQGSSMTLIGGRFSESVLPAVLPNLFQRYTSLARVELGLTPALATANVTPIYELLPQMTALIHLGIWFPSNQAERFTPASRDLPRLSSFKGPCALLPHHLKTYCPTTTCVGDSLSILQQIPLACRESLRLLDLSSSARVTSTFLTVAPDIWPNIEELWLFSAPVSRGQAPVRVTHFINIFKIDLGRWVLIAP